MRSIISFLLQLRELEFGNFKEFAPNHIASKWQNFVQQLSSMAGLR